MAENFVFNLSDMESKVREATNNNPWGTPTSLMAQIAAGTFNIHERKEIMGIIMNRLLEKSGTQWRQAQKTVILVEYLLENGSIEFVQDMKSHITLIRKMKYFYYTNEEGEDLGIKVRTAGTRVEKLLQDENMLGQNRLKAEQLKKRNFRGFEGNSDLTFLNMGKGKSHRSMSTSSGLSISADEYNHIDSFTDNDTHSEEENIFDTNMSSFSSDAPAINNDTELKKSEDEEYDEDEFSDFISAKPVIPQSMDSQIPRSMPNIDHQLILQGDNEMTQTNENEIQLGESEETDSNNDLEKSIVPRKSDPFEKLFLEAKS